MKVNCSVCKNAEKGEPLYNMAVSGYGPNTLYCTYCLVSLLPDRTYVCDVGDEI